MAQRYGGKHSPDPTPEMAQSPYQNARRSRAGGRVNFMFLAPLPLAFSAFGNGPTALVLNLGALGILLLAAWLTREGILAQEAYEARKVARRPLFPRKSAGSLLTGIGLGLAGYASDGNLLAVAAFTGVGAVLHSLAFGLDPMKDKGLEGVDTFQTDRVARAVDEAEKHLAAMSEAIKRTRDRKLETLVEQFQTTARALFRTVEDDPRDLTAARKYLSVYLMGAKDATIKFSDLYTRTRNPEARADFEGLMQDLQTNFSARTQKMLLDDRSDMNIEIEVLRERLQREGLHVS